MSKAPKKHDDDVEEKLDSLKHHEDRKAKIEAENEQNQAAANTVAENQAIANFKGLPKEGETRDQLLDRIRAMRDEKPKEIETESFRSEGLLKEFTAEQEAGRAAVAKAAAEAEKYRETWQKEAAAGEKNQG